MKMKSKSTLPREFAAKKADNASDKAIAKRFGVKVKK